MEPFPANWRSVSRVLQCLAQFPPRPCPEFFYARPQKELFVNGTACIEMAASNYHHVLPCSRFARGFEVVFQSLQKQKIKRKSTHINLKIKDIEISITKKRSTKYNPTSDDEADRIHNGAEKIENQEAT